MKTFDLSRALDQRTTDKIINTRPTWNSIHQSWAEFRKLEPEDKNLKIDYFKRLSKIAGAILFKTIPEAFQALEDGFKWIKTIQS